MEVLQGSPDRDLGHKWCMGTFVDFRPVLQKPAFEGAFRLPRN